MSEAHDFSPLFEYYQQLWDTFREGICITDKDGRVLLLNTSYSEISGIPKEAMIGRRVEEFVRSGMLDIVLNPEIVRTRQPVTRIQKVSNGRQIVLEGSPVLDARGEVALCITLIKDGTVLADLRAELSRQKELLEALQHIANAGGGVNFLPERPVASQSPAMRKLDKELAVIADTDATVLLLGETGVGKDVTARRIHALSPRAEGTFIKVDCGSIPEHLIETELFGYVGGTFSGGSRNGKIGLFEAADGGTLFLDEIGELPLRMQTRLLRFLQDKEILRVGSISAKRVDVRIVAATNRELELAVERGEFRSDLYYRVKVAELRIPPLRERKSDIPPLARMFLESFNARYRKKKRFSDEALESLVNYKWPGNVRELENVIQRAVITARKDLLDRRSLNLLKDCRNDEGPGGAGLFELEGKSYAEVMSGLERAMLREALRKYGGITKTAESFGVARSTIFRKVKRYGLEAGEGDRGSGSEQADP